MDSVDVSLESSTCVDYVMDVSELLDGCCRRLSMIGPMDTTLSDLALYLATIERQMHMYVLSILSDAGEASRPRIDDSSLMITVARLSTIRDSLNTDYKNNMSHKTGGVNSLLFYLINTLQLCLQRIEDADKILCGAEAAKERNVAWNVDMRKRNRCVVMKVIDEEKRILKFIFILPLP